MIGWISTFLIAVAALYLMRSGSPATSDAPAISPLDDHLFLFARTGNTTQCNVLLAKGADPLARLPKRGHLTPIHAAAASGSLSTVAALLAALESDKRSPGGGAVVARAMEDDSGDRVDPLLLPIDRLKDAAVPLTPAHVAAEKHHQKVLAVLIKWCPFWLSSTDSGQRTPLHAAALAGAPSDLIEMLISMGSDADARSSGGATAAMEAAGRGHSPTLGALLTFGADVFATDIQGQNAVHYAAHVGAAEAILVLLSAAHEAKGEDGMNELLCQADVKGRGGFCVQPTHIASVPLHHAAERGDNNGLMALLQNSPTDKPLSMPDSEGFHPLHLAARMGHSTTARLLLGAGADAKARQSGNTPLHTAILEGKSAVMTAMLDLAEDSNLIEARNANQQTPLHLSVSRNDIGLTELLLLAGADPAAIDGDGKTVIELAKGTEMLEVLQRKRTMEPKDTKTRLQRHEDAKEKFKQNQ